jgi:hypothetical protein
MPVSATTRSFWPSRRLLVRLAAAAVFAALLLTCIALVANSRLPRRAAGIYGGLFERIQQHPELTAAICLAGVALVWVGIALVAAMEGCSRQPR